METIFCVLIIFFLARARTLRAHRILKTFYQWHLFGVRNGNAKRSETNNSKRWRELKNDGGGDGEEAGDGESGKKRRPYLLIHIELSVIKSVGYATLFEIFTAFVCLCVCGVLAAVIAVDVVVVVSVVAICE